MTNKSWTVHLPSLNVAQIVGRAGQSLGRGHRPVRRPHRDVHFDDFDRLRQPFDVISEQKNVKMNANVEILVEKIC